MKIFNYSLIACFIILTFLSCKQKPSLPDPLEAGWKGQKMCKVLENNDKLRVLKCTFPPGTGHEKHYHKPHFGYVLAGSTFRIQDTTGIKEIPLKTGTYFNKPKGVIWHEAINIGDSTAIFLIVEPK